MPESAGLDLFKELPDPPEPSDAELAEFHDISDWTGLFFEWHKTVGILALMFSHMFQHPAAVKRMARKKYIILSSMLNRCARLMMANLCMASENRHAEAIFIIDRALHETAIKLIWLCRSKAKDRFEIYLADGLKNDLKFEATIRSQIETRGFKTEIERRMLHSIQRSIATSGIARRKVIGSKRLPSLETIMRELGMGDLGYDVVQRMGSHHVHGTWTTLLSHNIEKNDPMLPIKGEFNPPHPNQLMFGSMIVLEGILAFVECVIRRSDRGKVIKVIEAYRTSLMKHNDMMAHKDWQPASKDIEGARGSRVTR